MSNTVTLLDSNGHPIHTYSTITDALSNASTGDTVFVGNGVYNENVALVNGVNIEGQSQAGVLIIGTMSTPANFDNVTVSNLSVDDASPTAMLLDMTGTQEVTGSTFSNVTFNLLSNSTATVLIGNGQVAGSMALHGAGLTFSNVSMNSNDNNFAGSTAFAYTLFHSVGGAQLVLNGVSLNGTASGTNSGLGAQWNMSPNSGEVADVTIENSSTSGGGNFYVSGMASATITNNTFNGQGLALNGVAGATVTGNTFENIDGTYNANGTQHRGLTIENAWGALGDSNITIENNTFSNITAADGAIAFQRWTDNNGNLIPATIAQLNNIDVQSNTFSGVSTPVYLNPGSFNSSTVIPDTFTGSQLIIGTAGADTINDTSTGPMTIFGGGGGDTIHGSSGNTTYYASQGDNITDSSGTDTVVATGNFTLPANVENLTLSDGDSSTQTFDNMPLGSITNGEDGWIVNTPGEDEGVVAGPDGTHEFKMSSDPGNTAFGGPYSPGLSVAAGEPDSGAQFSGETISYQFQTVDPTPDGSRLEVDFGNADGTDRNNFLVIESAPGGIRIAVSEPDLSGNFSGDNVDPEPNDWRQLTSGVDPTVAHTLTMQLAYVDRPNNDVINVYLDGQFIGTTTTFENYHDSLNGVGNHDPNAAANLTDRIFFRPSPNGAPQDGPGGQNQGFYFDNISNSVYNNSSGTGNNLDNVITGNDGNNVLTGLGGNDTLIGGGGFDTANYLGTLTASNFSYDGVNSQWAVNASGDGQSEGTDTLSQIETVTDGAGHRFLLVGGGSQYQTIQEAVDAAQSGDTILVAPGTYNEQVVVDATHGASGITIEGVGSGVNVDAPTAPGSLHETAVSPISGNAIDGIFTVDGVNNVTITGLTVNGLQEGDDTYFAAGQPGEASLVGIAYVNSTGGSINNVTVEDTRETDAGIGDQRNFGIVAVNNNTLTGPIPTQSEAANLNTVSITNSNLSEFQKGGIVVEYANATISGNTLTGLGAVNTAQNAIEIRESTGTVSNNTTTDIGYIGAVAATGVLAFFDQGLVINGNSFTGASGSDPVSPVGVYVLDSDNGQITNNTATNVDNGVAFLSDAFGADSTGTWTVSGNTATNVVAQPNGAGIFFDADPTNPSSSFTVNDSGANTSDELFLTPGTDTLTGGDAGGNAFVVLQGSDLSASDTINGGGGIGNAIDFAPTAANDALTIGNNVSNIQAVNVVDQNQLVTNGQLVFTDTLAETVDISNAPGNLTITGNNGGDTFIAGTGSETINGGSGIDTAEGFGADFKISIGNGHWVVSNDSTSETLSGIEKVVIAGKTYDLVDNLGANGGFQSLQAAIDAGQNGDTILVAPGTYTESAHYNPNNNTDDPNFANPVGLLVNKSVTIEGVDGSGNPITNALATQATVISSIESDWGTNFYVTAPNVMISGLEFRATDLEYGQNPQNQGIVNKAFEDVANNFTLENSLIDAAHGVPLASSVYIDELTIPTNQNGSPNLTGFQSVITQYNVTGNILTGDFVEASGVGFGHPTSSLSLNLTNNEFALNAGTTADTYATADGGFANVGVILNGDLYPEVGWDLAPVVAPTITGNTVASNYTESPTGARFFANDNSASNLPGLSYIQNYVADNNVGTYAYVLTPGGDLQIQNFFGAPGYEIYLNVADATAPANSFGPDGADAGDTVIVQSGSDGSVQTIQTDNLTIEALSGSNALDLSLGSGVTTITLADFASGTGARVTVIGNNSGDTITGNDGNDTLTGGAGNDTFNLGSGNNTVTGDGGLDTAHFSSTLTPADFTFSNGAWVVTNGASTDDLNGISLVTDGVGHTFLLVGGGSQYATDAQARTSAQFQTGDIIIGVTTNTSIAITSGLSNNTPRAGTPLQATVSFTNGDSAPGPITYTWFANGNPVQSGTSSTYTPTEANLGAAITVDASFTDLFGDAILDTSSATSAVLDALPTVSDLIVSGVPQVGQTLTASATASPADDTLTFEWFSSADNFTHPIANGPTFTVTTTSNSLEVEAIATNANGVQATAISGEITPSTPKAPAGNPPHVAGSNVDEWILSNGGHWFESGQPGSIPSGYAVAGIGDFTGNGTSDILWQNATTGDTQEWLISNYGWAGTVDLGKHPGSFQIAGVGDFTGNGIGDVLWTQSTGSGVQTDIWELSSSGQWSASVSPGTHPAGYNVVGVGDFNGNGTSDILWQNSTTGDVDEWQIANGQWSASVDLGSHPGGGWTIAGVGDFFGNGIDDILWTNSTGRTVQTDIWQLGSNGQWVASVSPGTHPAGYQVATVGNFADTGIDGILWFNPSTGDTDEWDLNNGKWAGSIDLGSHPGSFQISGAGAFVSGDATSDILWQQKT